MVNVLERSALLVRGKRWHELDQARAAAWPLWCVVAETMPELVLDPLRPPRAWRRTDRPAVPVDAPDWAAYRTVVELADALYALSGNGVLAQAERRVRALFPEVDGSDLAVCVAAEVLAEGFDARRTGDVRTRDTAESSAGEVVEEFVLIAPGRADLVDELGWWGRVAEAYRLKVGCTGLPQDRHMVA